MDHQTRLNIWLNADVRAFIRSLPNATEAEIIAALKDTISDVPNIMKDVREKGNE